MAVHIRSSIMRLLGIYAPVIAYGITRMKLSARRALRKGDQLSDKVVETAKEVAPPHVLDKAHAQYYFPSLSPKRCVQHTLIHGRKLISAHYETVINADMNRGMDYVSGLYSVSSVGVGDSYWTELADVDLVAPSGLVVLPDGRFVGDSVFKGTLPDAIRSAQFARPGEPKIVQRALSLLCSFVADGNYGHWLMDVLVRVSLFDPPYDFAVIIPAGLPSYIRGSLQAIGFSDEAIIEAQPGRLHCDRLLVAHTHDNIGVPNAYCMNRLRSLFRSCSDDTMTAPADRVYVSRRSGSRRIVNEAELLPILNDYGFQAIQSESLSFAQQLSLFSKARYILGPHGAGMCNTIVSSPGAFVAEIFNEKRWEHTIKRAAQLLGHNHWHIWGRNAGSGWETYVDPQDLRDLLESGAQL